MRTEPTKEQRAAQAVGGRRYAQARRDILNLDQGGLARMLGLDKGIIVRRENGRRRIKNIQWLALCGIHQLEAFKSLDVLLCGFVATSLKDDCEWKVEKTGDQAQSPKSLPSHLSKTIEAMREACGMSPVQWAGSLGVDTGTVRNAENPRFGISREMFFANVALFVEVKFQKVDLQRRTHRYPKHLQEDERG
jgi:DNA-binding transcriptional regulator YiaG